MKSTYDTGAMRRVSKELMDLSDEYSAIYNRLIQNATTMGEAYKAPDSLDFENQIKGFEDDLKAMTEHIRLCAQALEQQAKNQEARSEDNSMQVKKLIN